MAMELIQKPLEDEISPSLICCFEDLENTCLKVQRDSDSYCSHLKRLKKFLEQGILDVNTRYEHGNTILHLAAKDANAKATKLLLDSGANVNVRNNSGETPIFSIFPSKASNERKRECVEIFMLHGADYDLVNSEKETIIKVALKNGSFFSLQPIVAHLAWLKELGSPGNGQIFDQVSFVRTLKKYYRTSVQHLHQMKSNKIVGENITEYEILTQNEEKIASYMRNPGVVRKLEQHKVNSDYYYYNSLFKVQILKAMERLDAAIVFRKSIKLFQYSSHIIVDKIICHLSHDDLHNLKHVVEEYEKEDEINS